MKPPVRTHPLPSEQGAAAIEFTISVVVLFTLIFGCIAVALAFYTYEVLNEYARDASRYAIVHGNGCNSPINGNCSISTGATANTALTTYLNHQIFPGINGTKLTVTTSYTTAPGLTTCFATNCNGAGDQVTVKISYPYLYAVPFVPQRSFTMNASSTMIITQ